MGSTACVLPSSRFGTGGRRASWYLMGNVGASWSSPASASRIRSACIASTLRCRHLAERSASAEQPHNPGVNERPATTLITWGSGWRGQLGTMRSHAAPAQDAEGQSHAHAPWHVDMDMAMVCGSSHTMVLEGARAWVWGRNCSGQLGLGDRQDRPLPTQLHLPFARPAQRDEDGDTLAVHKYAVGAGLGAQNDTLLATEIVELRDADVRMVACGDDFTIAASENRVWGFGNGAKVRGEMTHDYLTPILLDTIPPPIRKVVCGWGHTLLLTGQDVFAWGANQHGQCGQGHVKYVPMARKLDMLAGEEIIDIAAGSTHSLALTRAGDIFVWGSHADGKLGVVTKGDLALPQRLDRLSYFGGARVVQLAAGADHTAVLTEDGALWLWGFGQHKALGFGEGKNELQPRCLNTHFPHLNYHLKAVSCGMDITIAHTQTHATTRSCG